MTASAWTRAIVVVYVGAVVIGVTTVVGVLLPVASTTTTATIAAPALLAATLRPVGRAARHWTGADRTALAPLETVARSLGSDADADEALALTAASIGAATGAKLVLITPASNASPVLWRTADVSTSDACLSAPIRHARSEIGRIEITGGAPLTSETLSALAAQAAPAVRNVQVRAELAARLEEGRARAAELRAARRRIVEAGDRERRRLERDVHDGAQQCLMALVLRLGLAARPETRRRPHPSELLELAGAARRALVDAATGLAGRRLETDGLVCALEQAAAGSAVTVTADGPLPDTPPDVLRAVYFSCAEAIQNALKHASAATVTVHLSGRNHGWLSFTVRDDGIGFDPDNTEPGFGLSSLRDRLSALGGEFDIRSSPGNGTEVRGRLPIDVVASA